MTRRILFLASLLLAGTSVGPRSASAMLLPGAPAPDFRGTDLSGVSRRLFDYRGKVVILFVLGSS